MVSNERVFGVGTYDVIDLAERKLFNFVDIGRERKKNKRSVCAALLYGTALMAECDPLSDWKIVRT